MISIYYYLYVYALADHLVLNSQSCIIFINPWSISCMYLEHVHLTSPNISHSFSLHLPIPSKSTFSLVLHSSRVQSVLPN